ncbi:E3 ubiquitin-protein ligase znrf1 isoform X2 [Dunckerocampus dactyliophorus]|uniref:E3 ubiquitin-protein ligase znrf1 isoform X2 n=1 Tax=Dunckerocampus dactyliophorus TaxID=161453 RepID=UPI0024050DF7|nr:E3 ubiquitin-protein ligase znrf1 isoform X2 [Dunckerocampus dactyliophorus]
MGGKQSSAGRPRGSFPGVSADDSAVPVPPSAHFSHYRSGGTMGLRSRSASSVAAMGIEHDPPVPFGFYTPRNTDSDRTGGGAGGTPATSHGTDCRATGGGRHRTDGVLYLGSLADTLPLHITPRRFSDHSDKTKEMIIDPRTREKEPHRPLFIDETEVERVKTFKFLGTHISEDLTWSHNTQQMMKKSQRRLYFLRRLRKFGMSTTILSCFYRCTMESVLTASITVWYGNCTTRDRKALQRVIKTSQNIVGAALPSLQDIYKTRVLRRTHNLIKDSTHPQHSLFTLLPSGRRYRSLKSRTTRLANSFYPQAIRLLNEALTHAARNTRTHS